LEDLENIDLSGLTKQEYLYNYSLNFGIFGYPSGNDKGSIYLNGRYYFDGYYDFPFEMVYVRIYGGEDEIIDFYPGDYITLVYDGGQMKNIYIPEYHGELEYPGMPCLYVGFDGSTYYDPELTELAASSAKSKYPRFFLIS